MVWEIDRDTLKGIDEKWTYKLEFLTVLSHFMNSYMLEGSDMECHPHLGPGNNELTHLPLVLHIWVSELGSHWFM